MLLSKRRDLVCVLSREIEVHLKRNGMKIIAGALINGFQKLDGREERFVSICNVLRGLDVVDLALSFVIPSLSLYVLSYSAF